MPKLHHACQPSQHIAPCCTRQLPSHLGNDLDGIAVEVAPVARYDQGATVHRGFDVLQRREDRLHCINSECIGPTSCKASSQHPNAITLARLSSPWLPKPIGVVRRRPRYLMHEIQYAHTIAFAISTYNAYHLHEVGQIILRHELLRLLAKPCIGSLVNASARFRSNGANDHDLPQPPSLCSRPYP